MRSRGDRCCEGTFDGSLPGVAQLVIEEGESILFKVQGLGNVRETHAACELIATDRRLVLTSVDTKPTVFAFLGLIGGLLDRLFGTRTPKVTHEIRRHVFGTVEVTGKRDVRIESTGEGYAKQWFEVSTKEPQQLADRIDRWVAGQPDVIADLPVARVHED